jgi:PilZ domain
MVPLAATGFYPITAAVDVNKSKIEEKIWLARSRPASIRNRRVTRADPVLKKEADFVVYMDEELGPARPPPATRRPRLLVPAASFARKAKPMHIATPRVRERRASARVSSKQRVFVFDPADALEEVYAGWIVDRSQGGVCLSLARSGIEEGSVLLVRPTAVPAPLGIEVRVRNCRHKHGNIYLGCEFVQRVPARPRVV